MIFAQIARHTASLLLSPYDAADASACRRYVRYAFSASLPVVDMLRHD